MSKIIISDTSCLIALSNIKELRILKDLFREIIITPEVSSEFGEGLSAWLDKSKGGQQGVVQDIMRLPGKLVDKWFQVPDDIIDRLNDK